MYQYVTDEELLDDFMYENKLLYVTCNERRKQPHIYVVTSDTSKLIALQSFIYREGLRYTFSKISQDAYDSFNRPIAPSSSYSSCFDNPYWNR